MINKNYLSFNYLNDCLNGCILCSALYASDWGIKPFIVQLAMDGSEAKKIITEDLIWPNALAIDYVAKHLYWADAFRDVIEFILFFKCYH